MDDMHAELDHALMVDGNAVAGLLQDIFALEMTAIPAECAHCGNVAAMGQLWTFTQAPGVVLRCPACEGVMLRIVQTPDAIFLDVRGVVTLRLARPAS